MNPVRSNNPVQSNKHEYQSPKFLQDAAELTANFVFISPFISAVTGSWRVPLYGFAAMGAIWATAKAYEKYHEPINTKHIKKV